MAGVGRVTRIDRGSVQDLPGFRRIVLDTFETQVAPGYCGLGIVEFRKSVDEEALSKRFSPENDGFAHVFARMDGILVGVGEIRFPDRISLLFVDGPYQKRGVGRALYAALEQIARDRTPGLRLLEAEVFPNGVAFFRKMGFSPTDEVQMVNGIRFVPMERRIV